jgi:hypothetical protein
LILIWGAELASEYSKYRRKRSELSPAKLVVSESRG